MKKLEGIAASPGVSLGRIFLLDIDEVEVPQRHVGTDRVPAELERLEDACRRAHDEILALRERMTKELGGGSGSIFDAHAMMLQDPQLRDEISARIRQNTFTADHAVDRTFRKYIKKMRSIGDPYAAQRAADFNDLRRRLLHLLQGEQYTTLAKIDYPVILVAHDLTPSRTAGLDRRKILGIATDLGGRGSHMAILARDLGIPAVVGLSRITSEIEGGERAIVDGRSGTVIVDPDQATIEAYLREQAVYATFEAKLLDEKDFPAVTRDGRRVEVYANIDMVEEVDDALSHGAAGIGLFRTEFLYLRSGIPPTEEDHYKAYCRVQDGLPGRPITLRTIDLGADKMADPDFAEPEKNPSLGCRSVRLSRAHPDVFKTQIRAILRASHRGHVKCMLPMVTSLEELRWARDIVRRAKDELTQEKLLFDHNLELGIMVEVPAAAVQASAFAQEVDFFSIGTNDLIQYTLAVDRTNKQVADLYQPVHPAVLRLIQEVIHVGEWNNIPVSMCGEMAGDPMYVLLLLGMGLREFSVSPVMVPEIKKIVREAEYPMAQTIAEEVFRIGRAADILAFLKERTNAILPGAV